MFKFWRLADGQQLFFSPPDGGGAGGDDGDDGGQPNGEASDGLEHPEFEAPIGGGDDDGAAAAGGEGGGTPRGEAGERPRGGQRPKGAVDSIPKHRLDEVIQRENELKGRFAAIEAENKRFKSLLMNSLGITDPNQPAAPRELTDRERAIQKRLRELLPGIDNLEKLGRLAERAEALESLVESVPDFNRQNELYWNRVAQTMVGGMENQIAPLVLGEGKLGKDLSKDQKLRFRRDFSAWVQADEERVARYESLDQTLIEDFVTDWDETTLAPIRRRYGADAISRNRGAARLPVGGNSSAPAGTPKPKAKALDEDSAADAAWSNFKERVAAGG